MWSEPTESELARIPKLYETEDVKLKDKKIYLHFFLGSCDWFIAEFDGKDTFFGYANLGNPDFAEWGYISFRELKELNVKGMEVDNDKFWKVKKASEIPEIKS